MLTPHAGELGRLLELDSDADRARAPAPRARGGGRARGAVVVLKGDDTLVADPAGLVAVSPGASPALATAGTGDVLTGVIAALLAQGLDAVHRGRARACWLHAAGGPRGRRGGTAAAEGVIASDVIEALPAVRARAAQREQGTRRRRGRGDRAAGS